MELKIIISKDEKEHEKQFNSFFKKNPEIIKPLMFHKIVKAKDNKIGFLSYIHYRKNE